MQNDSEYPRGGDVKSEDSRVKNIELAQLLANARNIKEDELRALEEKFFNAKEDEKMYSIGHEIEEFKKEIGREEDERLANYRKNYARLPLVHFF